jgi:hypothetical protein
MSGEAMIENILLEGDESPRRKKKILRSAIVVGGKLSVTTGHHHTLIVNSSPLSERLIYNNLPRVVQRHYPLWTPALRQYGL